MMEKYISDEFKELNWESKLPIMITLATDEKTTSNQSNQYVRIILI